MGNLRPHGATPQLLQAPGEACKPSDRSAQDGAAPCVDALREDAGPRGGADPRDRAPAATSPTLHPDGAAGGCDPPDEGAAAAAWVHDERKPIGPLRELRPPVREVDPRLVRVRVARYRKLVAWARLACLGFL